METTQKRIVELRPHADKPFEHEEKLEGLARRQQEIMDALDLEKNQASNRLDAEAVPVIEEPIGVEEAEVVAEKKGVRMAMVNGTCRVSGIGDTR